MTQLNLYLFHLKPMRTFEGAIAAPDFQLIAPSLGHHFSFQSGQHLISFLCDIVSFSPPPPPPSSLRAGFSLACMAFSVYEAVRVVCQLHIWFVYTTRLTSEADFIYAKSQAIEKSRRKEICIACSKSVF